MVSSASLESTRALMLDMLSGKTRKHVTQELLILVSTHQAAHAAVVGSPKASRTEWLPSRQN
jgi:hypothetical protein